LPPEILSVLPKSIAVENHADFLDMNLKEARANFERDYLSAQLQRFSGNITKAAEAIGMERSALHRKIKSLKINTQDTAEALDSSDQISEDSALNKSYKKTG
jgi:two-component system nitrogen regulation response regulator NtrX